MNNLAGLDISASTEVATTEDASRRPFYEPGWYKDLSNNEYHGSFGTSSTTLKTLIEKTPAHLDYQRRHPKEPTPNMALGTAVHTLVLEPETFDDEITVLPELKLTTVAGRAERDQIIAQNPGKVVITAGQYDKARRMADAVNNDPIASAVLADIIPESSIYWWYNARDPEDDTQYREMLKVRPDAINPAHGFLIDLKTCADASYSGFQRSIQNFYYHVSAAMYLTGVNQCRELLDETNHIAYLKFAFICVEPEPPYLVAKYDLSREYLDIGKIIFARAVRDLHLAKQNNWPGFPEEIRVIEPPGYASRSFIV